MKIITIFFPALITIVIRVSGSPVFKLPLATANAFTPGWTASSSTTQAVSGWSAIQKRHVELEEYENESDEYSNDDPEGRENDEDVDFDDDAEMESSAGEEDEEDGDYQVETDYYEEEDDASDEEEDDSDTNTKGDLITSIVQLVKMGGDKTDELLDSAAKLLTEEYQDQADSDEE